MKLLNRLYCWWFGHAPDYQARMYGDDCTPCERCGIEDIDYGDLVQPSRHEFLKAKIPYLFYRKWFPAKCPDCGHRYKCDETNEHIPF